MAERETETARGRAKDSNRHWEMKASKEAGYSRSMNRDTQGPRQQEAPPFRQPRTPCEPPGPFTHQEASRVVPKVLLVLPYRPEDIRPERCWWSKVPRIQQPRAASLAFFKASPTSFPLPFGNSPGPVQRFSVPGTMQGPCRHSFLVEALSPCSGCTLPGERQRNLARGLPTLRVGLWTRAGYCGNSDKGQLFQVCW